MLEVRDITKVYNPGTVTEQRLFDHFSLTVEEGQFVSIVGSNGSGKTSLLNIICGSIPIEGGDVLVGGKSIARQKDYQRYASMGRVYQNPAAGTAPNLTMLENLSLADNKGRSFGLSRGVNRRRVDFYRQQLQSLGLGLEDKLDVKMGALSGGQRQAVALLMATMTPLQFLILDEHTAALDPKTAEIIMELTDKVIREKHLTAMMVTHNLRHAVEYGDRILMMSRGHVVLDRAGAEKRATSMDEHPHHVQPDLHGMWKLTAKTRVSRTRHAGFLFETPSVFHNPGGNLCLTGGPSAASCPVPGPRRRGRTCGRSGPAASGSGSNSPAGPAWAPG